MQVKSGVSGGAAAITLSIVKPYASLGYIDFIAMKSITTTVLSWVSMRIFTRHRSTVSKNPNLWPICREHDPL
jgi:hypothetical protein